MTTMSDTKFAPTSGVSMVNETWRQD